MAMRISRHRLDIGDGRIDFGNAAEVPEAPAAGVRLWAKDDRLYAREPTGDPFAIAASVGGGGGSGVPVGTVIDYAGATEPTDWIFCFGQNVSRTTYADLFAVLGTAYGSGDGSTTFGLPDLRGRVAAGRDDMGGSAAGRLTNSGTGNPGINGATLGAAGGSDRHQLSTAQLASHTHTVVRWVSGSASVSSLDWAPNGTSTTTYATSSAGSNNAHPNTQPTIVLNKIIYAGESS